MRLVLASASPRRAALLTAAGLAFEAVPVHIDEALQTGERPEAAAARLAEEKAAAAAEGHPAAVVVAADTIVVIDGVPLGKPENDEDARRMLRLLAGRTHEVMTAVCVRSGGRSATHVDVTRVSVLPLTDPEIDRYVASGEPADKAGAYAIQGRASRFVARIEGSYSNVVGLPVSTVCRLLNEVGCDILDISI